MDGQGELPWPTLLVHRSVTELVTFFDGKQHSVGAYCALPH